MSKCDSFKVGDKASIKKIATSETVIKLAEISGDKNPVHLDDVYAASTVFGKRIAHGLFCLGMISNLLGTQLPGNGTVLVSEVINYKRPVFIDDVIETTVEIDEIIAEKNKIKMSFSCINQNDVVVLYGYAIVKIM